MDNWIPLAISLGAAAGGAILLLTARRLSQVLPGRKHPPGFPKSENLPADSASAEAVLIVQAGGLVKYMNSAARAAFNIQPEELPNLERLARRVRPTREFIHLCSTEGSTRLSINGRLMEARSFNIPLVPASLTLIALREADILQSLDRGALSPAVGTLHAISELSQAITGSLDVEATLSAIFQALQQLLPADSLHINLWDEANQVLVPYTQAGTSSGEDVLLRSDPIQPGRDELNGWLMSSRLPVFVGDAAENPLPAPSRLQAAGMRSILAVPMIAGKDTVGTLEAGCVQPGKYEPGHLELLQLVSGQAAIALRNASLFQQEQKRAAELSTLAQLTQAIGTVDNLKELISRLVSSITPLVNVSTLGFLVCNHEEGSLECQAVFQGIHAPTRGNEAFTLENLPAEALLAQDVLISENASDDPQWGSLGFSPLAKRLELRDTVLAPLVSGNQPVGYLLAANHSGSAAIFSRDEIHLLLIIANQTAPMIENTRLVEQAHQRAESAEALRRIASLAASDASLDDIIARSMKELASQTGSDAAVVLLLESSQSCLAVHPASLLGEAVVLEAWAREIHEHNPLYETTVSHTRRPLVISPRNDLNPDQQVYLPLLRSLQVQSGVVIPLVARDVGIGELLIGSRHVRQYDSSHMQLITTAAAQLASVVERARLYSQTDESLRRRVDQLTALTGITRELNTSLDPRYLLQLVYDECLRTTGATCGAILLLNITEGRAASKYSVQYSVGDTHSPELSELEEQVTRSGKYLTVADFSQTPWLPGHLGIGSSLLVPISYQEKVAGLIHLHSNELGHFDQTAVEITSALALQAASVLNNALQYQEQIRRGKILDRQAQTLTYLAATAQELRHEQSLEDALASVSKAIRDAALFQVVLISLYQPADGTLRRVYAEGIPDDLWEDLRSHTHPWRSVVQMLQPQYRIHNSYFIPVEQEPLLPQDIHMVTVLPSTSRQEEDAWDPDDMLAIPLYGVDGSPLGLITVDAPLDGRRPDRQTIDTVEVFATQAAVAIENYWRKQALTTRLENITSENKQLYDRLQAESGRRQLEAAVHMESSRRMASQGASAILGSLLDSALLLLPGAQAGFVVSWDVKTLCLTPKIAHGYPDYSSLLMLRYPVGGTESGQSILAEVFLRGQVRRVEQADVVQSYHFNPVELGVYNQALGDRHPQSSLFVPIRSGDANLGVLVLDSFDQESAFSALDETLALSLTHQAALAMEKDRFYRASEERSRQLQALTQVAGTLTFSRESQVLVDSALDQLSILVPFDQAELWLVSGDGFNLVSSRGRPENSPSPVESHAPLDHPLFLDIAQSGQAVLIGDTSQDLRFVQGGIPLPGCWLGLPLLSKGELMGLVTLLKTDPDYYTSEHIQLVMAFCGQVAIALENSHLFEETHQLTSQLENHVDQRTAELRAQVAVNEALLKIMTELSASLDIDQVLARTLRVINESAGAQVSLVLLNQDGRMHVASRQVANLQQTDLSSRGSASHEKNEPSTRNISSIERQACQWVNTNRKALTIEDTRRTRIFHHIPKDTAPRSLVAVPLSHGEEILGAFLMMHSQPGQFSSQQVELAAGAGRQISVALKNSELFTVIRDQAENMGGLLRDQEIAASRSQAILEAVADGVVVTDSANCLSFINTSGERILNLKAEQVLKMDLDSFTSLLGTAAQPWDQAVHGFSSQPHSGGQDGSFQGRMTLENGQVVGIHTSPVVWRGRFLGTVSILRDITAEVMLDRMKSDFVANVSHELRTPMTSIKGYVEVLLMGAAGSLNEQQIQSLQVVRNNTERLGMLVDDLLDVSRIEAGRVSLNLESLDLAAIAEDVTNEIRRRSRSEGKPMEVVLVVEPGLPRVQGDRQRLRQVLNNLVANAFHYTPTGGRIDVSLASQGSEVFVEVKDNGIGILPQHQPRLFDRFYRGDDPLVLASPGTGLGLSIVKSLVEMHHGRLWFTSTGKRGEGSTFSFSLPALKQ